MAEQNITFDQGQQTLAPPPQSTFQSTNYVIVPTNDGQFTVEDLNENNQSTGEPIVIDQNGNLFVIRSGQAIDITTLPGLTENIESTGGSIINMFKEGWGSLTTTLLSSRAYGFMIGFLLFGFSIGSIGKLPMCMMSTKFRPQFCGQMTWTLLGITVMVLAAMSWRQLPDDHGKDVEELWQTWAIAIGCIICVIITLTSSMTKGSYGASAGIGGMY
jgi:hypothetical protein